MAEPEVKIIEKPTTALSRLDPQALITAAIEKGSDVETLERLVALAKDVREHLAREKWFAAMAAFQAECPDVLKTRIGQTRSYSYAYASLDDILDVVQPVMGRHGLSTRWQTRSDGTTVAANCLIAHELGHVVESGEVVIPVERSDDGRGATPAQRVAIAMQYAKRLSFKNVSGVEPDSVDTDGSSSNIRDQHRDVGAPAPDSDAPLDEGAIRKFWAIARGAKWAEDALHDLLASYQYNKPEEIRARDWPAIEAKLKAGPKK